MTNACAAKAIYIMCIQDDGSGAAQTKELSEGGHFARKIPNPSVYRGSESKLMCQRAEFSNEMGCHRSAGSDNQQAAMVKQV
jgi:hypothetical protein